jgi:hypothetical protein
MFGDKSHHVKGRYDHVHSPKADTEAAKARIRARVLAMTALNLRTTRHAQGTRGVS